MNRADLIVLLNGKVLSGGRRTKAVGVRQVISSFIDSTINTDDGGFVMNALVGYSTTLTPSDNRHFTSKKYVDDSIAGSLSGYVKADGSVSMTGYLKFAANTGIDADTPGTQINIGPNASRLYIGVATYIDIDILNSYLALGTPNTGVIQGVGGVQLLYGINGLTVTSNAVKSDFNILLTADNLNVDVLTPGHTLSIGPNSGQAVIGNTLSTFMYADLTNGIISLGNSNLDSYGFGFGTHVWKSANATILTANVTSITGGVKLLLNADAVDVLGAVTLQQLTAAISSTSRLQQGYDASGNTYPVAANTNPVVAAVAKGMQWYVTIAGTLGGTAVAPGDVLTALVNAPGQTSSNWLITENNFGFTPISNVLTSAQIIVGNSSNVATARALTGDGSISSTGALTISSIGGKTVTLGGNLATSGAFNTTFTITATTNVTFPTTGTLATLTDLAGYLPLTLLANKVVDLNTFGLTFTQGVNPKWNVYDNLFYDNSGQESLDLVNRYLKNSAGGVSVSYGTAANGFGIGNFGSVFFAFLKTTNLTANRIFQFPNIAGDILTQNSTATLTNKSGNISQWTNDSGYLTSLSGAVISVSGTTNRITSTGGATPVIDISASYVGQASITTLGTISTGTWNGSLITGTYGGTGVNNGSNTITLAGNLATSGAFALTLTTSGTTNVTLPTSGTLVNNAVTTLSSLVSIGTITTGVWNGTVITGTYGGTGVNNGASTITLGGSLTTSGAFGTTITVTGTTTVTLPTSGTLVNTAVTTLSSLVSIGTITTGVWNGTVITGQYGGTGVANTGKTITLGGSLITSGAFDTTITVTGTTGVTLPTSGTLVNNAVATLSSLVSIGTITTGTWNATVVAGQYGGTGVANTGKTITLGGNLTTSGAFAATFTLTNTTTVTFPTTGTLATLAGSEALTGKTVNGLTITTTTGTLTLVNGSSIITSGAFSITLTSTATTALTLPTTGTLATLAGSEALTNKSINGLTITSSTGTLTITNAKVLSVSNTLTFTGTDSSSVAFGAGGTVAFVGLANTWTAGIKQTFAPNATTSGFNFGSVAGDPSSPGNGDAWYDSTGNLLRARINGATVSLGSGSGTVTTVSIVTANGISGSVATATTTPAITLTLGAITPTTVNGLTITSTNGTLTLVNGSSLVTSGANSITLTSTGATNVTLPTTGILINNVDFPVVPQQRSWRSTLSRGNSVMVLTSATAYFVFLGKTTAAITPKKVRFRVSTGGTGAQTAEIGLFSTPNPPNSGNQTLTKLVSTATVDALTATGVVGNTSDFATSIPAGTYLWAGLRVAMATTQPDVGITGTVGRDYGFGRILTTTSAAALTGTTWSGVVPADSDTQSPDLQASLD